MLGLRVTDVMILKVSSSTSQGFIQKQQLTALMKAGYRIESTAGSQHEATLILRRRRWRWQASQIVNR